MPIYALGQASPSIDPTAVIDPTATLIGAVTIEADVIVGAAVVLRGDTAPITIGARSTIADAAVVHGGQSGTMVGADCVIGARAYLGGCVLERAVVVEARALILDGGFAGERAVVTMGSLVTLLANSATRRVASPVVMQAVCKITSAVALPPFAAAGWVGHVFAADAVAAGPGRDRPGGQGGVPQGHAGDPGPGPAGLVV